MSKFLNQSFYWCPFPCFSSNFVKFHIPLTQHCFLPSLPCKRKHQKPLDGERLTGLPTCFCTWLKKLWCSLSSGYLCLHTLVCLDVFILAAHRKFLYFLDTGKRERSPRGYSFLRNRPFQSSACSAGLPSKGFKMNLFFLLTSLQSTSLSFLSPYAVNYLLNSFNRKKLRP